MMSREHLALEFAIAFVELDIGGDHQLMLSF